MSPSHVNGADVLADTIVVLEVLQTASSAVCIAPFLGPIVGSVLSLVQTFNIRATDLANDSAATDESSQRTSTLSSHLKGNTFSRFLRHATIAEILDRELESLNDAWHSFDTACLIIMQQKIDRLTRFSQDQAVYDAASQLRLFRFNDLKLHQVRGAWRASYGAPSCDEWEGEWDGRAVVVRMLRSAASGCTKTNKDLALLASSIPRVHHPHVGQILGYSHPTLRERFYVLETGPIPIASYLKQQDVMTRVRLWLQMVIDFQDTYRYISQLQHGLKRNVSHRHHLVCLPSAALKSTGKLIIAAEDLTHANYQCFYPQLCRLYEAHHGMSPPLDRCSLECRACHTIGADSRCGDNEPKSPHELLSAIECERNNSNPLLTSRIFLGIQLYTIFHYPDILKARFGDFGHIDKKNGAFIPFGNIFTRTGVELKQKSKYWASSISSVSQVVTPFSWPVRIKRYTISRSGLYTGSYAIMKIVRRLDQADSISFWDLATDIAEQNKLSLQHLAFVDKISYVFQGGFEYDIECTDHHSELAGDFDEVPTDVFFYQLPLMQNGDPPSPWGYWSLIPEPTPGPWPILTLPGIKINCR
ncbi:hypothetical protein B0H21DRAFT_725264 [Amylocystis lapponica]|nr:hypothetical protein B0H21DRAFT_725264 [Amylocystis lapponica]